MMSSVIDDDVFWSYYTVVEFLRLMCFFREKIFFILFGYASENAKTDQPPFIFY